MERATKMDKQTREWLKRAKAYEKASDENYRGYFHKLSVNKGGKE